MEVIDVEEEPIEVKPRRSKATAALETIVVLALATTTITFGISESNYLPPTIAQSVLDGLNVLGDLGPKALAGYLIYKNIRY